MCLWNNFSESEDWKNVVLYTYPMKTKNIDFQGKKINLFDNGSYCSNAPYLSYGGDFSEDIIPGNFLYGIKKPVLIKSKQKLHLSENIHAVLVEDYKTFVLDLSGGLDDVWNNKIKSKTRNQVRKAEKTACKIKIGGHELLDDYYHIISRAWRDLGTPTHSREFYSNIITCFKENKKVSSCFMVIFMDDKPVSGACIIYDENSIYHPYAATLKEYNKYSLNNILYWNIIKFAAEKNIKNFDMGRSRDGQSTVKYKISWGAVQQQLYYYYFNKTSHQNDEDGKMIQFLIKMWKKLPLRIANFLGPKLIYKVLK